MSQHLFRIKFKELNAGHNGGLGEVKSFKASGRRPEDACRKLKKKAKIISVRKIG